MAKPHLFYANGTSYLINIVELGFNIKNNLVVQVFGDVPLNALPPSAQSAAVLTAPDGRTVTWDGDPLADPFPNLLDPTVWSAEKIPYPASALGIGASIDRGIAMTVKKINDLPLGTPFALGGYSQGAAVMSGVYNEIRFSSGDLYNRRNDFMGGVMFGNPRRQVNYRGEIGGTWSGAWDVANSTTGGHGSFPAVGSYARLISCEANKWIEFTAPDDIFSSSGDSSVGQLWTTANNFLLGKAAPDIAGNFILSALAGLIGLANDSWNAVVSALTLGGGPNFFIDAAEKAFGISGAGHTSYPFLPPPNSNGSFPSTSQVIDGKTYLRPSGKTCYQLALDWLNARAAERDTASLAVPDNLPGWSTTLVPPSS